MNFLVNGSAINLSQPSLEWAINPSTANESTPSTSRTVPKRSPLVCVKVIRADIGESGKPYNMNFYNMVAHINLYNEGEANVNFIKTKVREEMADIDLTIVGSNGLEILHQDGTQGESSKY